MTSALARLSIVLKERISGPQAASPSSGAHVRGHMATGKGGGKASKQHGFETVEVFTSHRRSEIQHCRKLGTIFPMKRKEDNHTSVLGQSWPTREGSAGRQRPSAAGSWTRGSGGGKTQECPQTAGEQTREANLPA